VLPFKQKGFLKVLLWQAIQQKVTSDILENVLVTCPSFPNFSCFLYIFPPRLCRGEIRSLCPYFTTVQKICTIWPVNIRRLLDRSTARYFYKRLKTSLHKPRGNFLENVFSKKCAFEKKLQLLEKKFLSQTNTIPKNDISLSKMAHF
jgi:hypothetical protein